MSFIYRFFLLFVLIANLFLNAKVIDLGTQGATYGIAEKDMYLELRDKYNAFRKDENMTKKLDKALKKAYYVDAKLPQCQKYNTYKKSFLFKINKPIIFQGVTIFKKGDSINLLEKMPLQGYLIFMDFATKKDKKLLKYIVKKLSDYYLRIYITKGNAKEAQFFIQDNFPQKNNIMIGKAPKVFIDKMNIKCTPTIAHQEDDELLYEEIRKD